MKKLLTMKKTIAVLFLIFSFTANATTYYFSTSGNDANNGTSTSTPWKTLSKFNSVFASRSPGDNFLFKRGEVFYGKMIISRSGGSGLPMTIGAYGTGAMPVITGFTTVSGWTSLGGYIWESTSTVSSLPYTNMVVVNGVNTAMGRYPNSGYFTYQSHGTSSITSNNLTGTPNWTGAELAFFITNYIMARDRITSQSGGTLNYSKAPTDPTFQADGKGFIIQNDIRTLDAQNEWYYNPSTKKLRIYSTSTPVNVKLPTIDTLAYLNARSYITFDNISFQGPNKVAILIAKSTNITIQNCDFSFSGRDAIFGPYAGNSTALKVENCTFNQINSNAIFVTPDFDHATIRLNKITNIGLLPGMGGNGSVTNGSGDYTAISAKGANALIELNTLDGIGYKGIQFYGSYSLIQKNFINNFCQTLIDGGGIYTWNTSPTISTTGIKVLNNIVLNGPTESGIYIDDNANGIEVTGNTIAGCSSGLYCHNNWNMTFRNNTMYDNSYAQYNMRHSSAAVVMRNNIYKNNIAVSKVAPQRAAVFYPLQDVAPAFITDSNYYARPMDDNLTIDTYYLGVYALKTFANLQTITGQEAHSHKSPKTITNVNDLRLEYNATTSSKTVTLDGNYIDVKNVSYNGSITLAPFASAVLIRNGTATGGTLLPAVNPANAVNGLNYKYFEATSYSVVPSFTTTPVKTGTTTNFNISVANRSTSFALNFTGYVNVPADGTYTFYTNSDDGSKLYIDNVLVANNDGLHWPVERSGTIGLKAGKHAISVGYFNQTGSGVLTVSYSGPGVSKQAIPASALYIVSGSVALNNNGNQIITSSAQVGVKAYPNPFASYVEVNVTGGAAGEYKLTLVDAAGRIVWTKSGTKTAGAFQQTINTSALQRGIYLLKVIQNNTSSVIKLVK